MPFHLLGPLGEGLQFITGLWPMSFTSVHYLMFLPLAVGGYFLLPGALRKAYLLLCSYWFYFFAAPQYLVVLLFGTLLSFAGGLWVSRAAAGSTSAKKRCIAAVFALVLWLCFFKYNGAFASILSPFFSSAGISYTTSYFSTVGALGISFHTFTCIGYLIDTYRGDTPAEKNLLNYALFLGFFPSVSMGPISRANSLLPQLKDTSRSFCPQNAAAALRMAGIGFFKKLAVADTLAVFTNQIYGNLNEHSGAVLSLAAIAFALQLYFDFSGYSDIAVASARLLGIKLPQNFNTPYFSTNFSGFWQRWHISLSSWLQDYIFTPLVWSRWPEKLPLVGKFLQKPPVLSSLAITFLLSGLWHGDTMCFLIWGALQAAFRIGEELLHRTLGKPKKKLPWYKRAGKTAVLLVLWTESLVFFKVGMSGGSISQAAGALVRQFVPSQGPSALDSFFTAILNGFYNDARIAAAFVAFMLLCLAVAIFADYVQFKHLSGAPLEGRLARLRSPARWACYYFIVACCFAGFLAVSGGFGGASFLYGGF